MIEYPSVPRDRGKLGTIYIKKGLDEIEKKLLLEEEFCHLYAHHETQLSVDQYAIAKCENQAKRMAARFALP
ncbi:ImmA/IrrE family metallo-endopeptidase [Sporosarcina newyorkensis]|uniref:IrrE N-terminal-like domain-containing protein n=1 Tax=Sporosarcina newyorkensis TaxID=759851 RepID=A0A1T4XRC1_9BACL|nr:ImmA/IrrE family metallo-endopeptidase [Sporosarcina newyorkensis]SKA92116.1 protein of unknown function [Sporosarcina newyorkensis]